MPDKKKKIKKEAKGEKDLGKELGLRFRSEGLGLHEGIDQQLKIGRFAPKSDPRRPTGNTSRGREAMGRAVDRARNPLKKSRSRPYKDMGGR